jgi:hypothetical protein
MFNYYTSIGYYSYKAEVRLLGVIVCMGDYVYIFNTNF